MKKLTYIGRGQGTSHSSRSYLSLFLNKIPAFKRDGIRNDILYMNKKFYVRCCANHLKVFNFLRSAEV